MAALKLSPTTLKTYARCHYAYALDKVVRVPRYKRVIGAQLHTGRAVHTVLESLVKQPELSREEAGLSLERTFAWNAYQDRETAEAAYKTARERLDAWVAAPYGWGEGETLAVEKLLSAPERDGLVLIGKPDLVRVHPDGTLEVVDHKSGRYVATAEQLKADFQAGVYRILAETRWPNYPRYQVSFSYLATSAVVPVTYTSTEVETWWELLLTIAERIQRARSAVENDIALEEAFPPNPGEQCSGCTFYRVCTFRERQL